jgi:glutamate synthase domain-containing protein 3
MVELEPLTQAEDINLVRDLVERHARYTRSTCAAGILGRWADLQAKFVKVTPRDYKRVLLAERRARAEGREPTFTELVGATGG